MSIAEQEIKKIESFATDILPQVQEISQQVDINTLIMWLIILASYSLTRLKVDKESSSFKQLAKGFSYPIFLVTSFSYIIEQTSNTSEVTAAQMGILIIATIIGANLAFINNPYYGENDIT